MFAFWLKTGIVGCGSLFFLILGIDNLVNAYSSTHPHIFIVLFFASSLIILISLTGMLFSILRIVAVIRNKGTKPL